MLHPKKCLRCINILSETRIFKLKIITGSKPVNSFDIWCFSYKMYNNLKTSRRTLYQQTVVKLVNLIVHIILNGEALLFPLFHIMPLGGSTGSVSSTLCLSLWQPLCLKDLLGTWLRA